MKPNRFERSYRDTAPAAGLKKQQSNFTPIIRTVGMIGMNCDNCGVLYETHACWAKRYNTHFCSTSCHAEYQREPVEVLCKICGRQFVTIRSKIGKLVTCGKQCASENRRRILGARAWQELARA